MATSPNKRAASTLRRSTFQIRELFPCSVGRASWASRPITMPTGLSYPLDVSGPIAASSFLIAGRRGSGARLRSSAPIRMSRMNGLSFFIVTLTWGDQKGAAQPFVSDGDIARGGLVTRILRKLGDPPELEEAAVRGVLAQAEAMLMEINEGG